MQAVRTFAQPPLSDSVTVHIPEEYRSYSLEVIVLPIMDGDFSFPSAQKGKTAHAKRKLGGFEEGFYMAPDFDAPLEEFAEYM